MKYSRGYVMILCAALFWGVSATGAKILLNRQLDTILLVQSRVTFSALILLGFYVLFKPHVLRVEPKDLWRFALLGILGIAGANFCYYYTIKESTVATGILIQYTAPLLVMGYAALTKEESVTGIKILAGVISLLGCFLAVGGYDSSVLTITTLGMLTGIGSILCFAFLNIFTHRVLGKYSVWTVAFYSIAFAAMFWLVLNPPWNVIAQSPPPETWRALVVLAVVSVLIPHTLYFAGLQYVAPSRAIITSTFEPIVAIVSSAIILHEYLEFGQILGALMVLGAIILLQIQQEPVTSGQGPHAS